MGDAFLLALGTDLAQTQRALPPHCLFCVPQPRALLADEALTQDVLYTHFLTPSGADERLGEYDTLNGKFVFVFFRKSEFYYTLFLFIRVMVTST
jgi:hypothetical protein